MGTVVCGDGAGAGRKGTSTEGKCMLALHAEAVLIRHLLSHKG